MSTPTDPSTEKLTAPPTEAIPGRGIEPVQGSSPALEDAYARRGRPGTVFWVSLAVVALLIIWAAVTPDGLNNALTSSMNWIADSFGWVYLLVAVGCIGLMVWLAFSRFGTVVLGRPDEKPEFSTLSWLAMIISAVMGIGLISYGVAEPVSHFASPPHGLAEAGTEDAAVRALQYSFLDWGPHAWAIFGVFGLGVAYSTHVRGNTGLVSPILKPLFGSSMDRWPGKVIDIFAVIATLFGTCTSLGLGASTIAEGAGRLFHISDSTFVEVVIIAGVTVMFTLSALTGVNKGIKFLSQATSVLSIFLVIFVLICGPTGFLGNLFFRSVGQYASDFFSMSLRTPLNGDDAQWFQWWTYFMMAWWLSWGAFVGVFLAKISRGRTIRQFVAGVMGVPSLIFFGWFTIFGGTAIKFDMDNGDGAIGNAALENVNNAFFDTLENMPIATVTTFITIVLVVLFFVSGADANTYVLSMLTSRGTLEPTRPVLGVWGLVTGLSAAVLLLVGGLSALQQASMLSAFPFAFIIALLAVSLVKSLREDHDLDYARVVRQKDLLARGWTVPALAGQPGYATAPTVAAMEQPASISDARAVGVEWNSPESDPRKPSSEWPQVPEADDGAAGASNDAGPAQ
ncbi:BCCT family transporter [Corynebacterium neomassiliense]|uniref:BCCT family transporter n=1 Tax=Corynebacterium neomassiliense TaxID=2079482 RepID=UPI00103278C1|nr:BCCT family transporter [Corynebacterium neomassiliense]